MKIAIKCYGAGVFQKLHKSNYNWHDCFILANFSEDETFLMVDFIWKKKTKHKEKNVSEKKT